MFLLLFLLFLSYFFFFFFFFFFSSRRRHTRCLSDWSSDVCSSDLPRKLRRRGEMGGPSRRSVLRNSLAVAAAGTLARPYLANAAATTADVWWPQGFVPEEDARSEERRVGKECRCGGCKARWKKQRS